MTLIYFIIYWNWKVSGSFASDKRLTKEKLYEKIEEMFPGYSDEYGEPDEVYLFHGNDLNMEEVDFNSESKNEME